MFIQAFIFILSSVDAAVMAGGRASCCLTPFCISVGSACQRFSAVFPFCDRAALFLTFKDILIFLKRETK